MSNKFRYQSRHLFCLSVLLFFFKISEAQNIFSGIVQDELSGLPITNASVYFNNTSIGTITNNAGIFAFNVNTIPNTELIVSSVGYEILAYKISIPADAGKRFVFKLTKKAKQLKTVLVLSKKAKSNLLDIFKKNFLGLTEEASRCTILNETDIYFSNEGLKGSFNAYADTAIIIKNPMLGYIISFQLVEFGFDSTTMRTYFYGYSRYDEMGKSKKYIRRRRDVYYGSSLHFYRSLITAKLKEEHYELNLKHEFITASGKKMYQIIPVALDTFVKKDSLRLDHFIGSKDDLIVQYYRQPSSKNYLLQHFMVDGNIARGFTSYIHFEKDNVGIDDFGILDDPLAVSYYGYWKYEKAANMLPFNYEPN